jgi:hypothetical protein
VGVGDLIEMLRTKKRAAALSLCGARGTGVVWVERGEITAARFGNLAGDEAVLAALLTDSGEFAISIDARDPLPRLSVHTSFDELLALARGAGPDRTNAPASVREAHKNRTATLRPGVVRIVSWLAPSPALGQQFDVAMRDPFALGDIHLLTAAELRQWTSDDTLQERFHVILLASLAGALPAMLALASPPGEAVLRAAISPGERVLALQFGLRGDRVLDVVLIDIEGAPAFVPSFERAPSLVLVAPPCGDIDAVGARGRAELERLLANVTPTVTLAVGNETTRDAISALPLVRARASVFDWVEADLEAAPDLRELLLRGIRTWAESTAPVAR